MLVLFAAGCSNDAGEAEGFMELLHPTPEAVESAEFDRWRHMQAETAACMRSAGFEYDEVPPERVLRVGTTWLDVAASDAGRFGYGLAVPIEVPIEVFDEPWIDPNGARLATLADSERAAWLNAFYGGDGRSGCADAATIIPTVEEARQALLFEHFADEFDEIQARVFSDPRVVKGEQAWVECMAEQGFTFSYPTEPVHYIMDALADLDPRDDIARAELQAFEIQVATADAACPFNNFGGWETAYNDLYREADAAFFEANQAAILALLDGGADSEE